MTQMVLSGADAHRESVATLILRFEKGDFTYVAERLAYSNSRSQVLKNAKEAMDRYSESLPVDRRMAFWANMMNALMDPQETYGALTKNIYASVCSLYGPIC